MAFGVKNTALPVPGFGDISTGPTTEALATKYDAEVLRRVTERMDEYDRNKDGYIDSEEWQRGRWDPPASERDKNKDGRLTREELAEHYHNRYRGGSYSGRGGPPGGSSSGGGPPQGGGPPFGMFSFGGGSFSGGFFSGGSSRGDSGSGSSTSSSTSGGTSGSSSSDRTQAYAEGMFRMYDENKDGTLQKSEWSRMRTDHSAADKNGDGLITKDELTERLVSLSRSSGSGGANSGGSGSKTAGVKKSYRFLPVAERLPKGLPSWFNDKDANHDGQVMMSEYASAWTDSVAAEFSRLDRNGDGILTAQESLAGEKKEP
jgi:Ca2+-binding EF-hand superfamily protein